MKQILLFLVTSVLVIGCSEPKKTPSDHSRDTQSLEKLFPILETDQVTAFRYQDWCQVIQYNRGSFAHSTEGEPPRPATRGATDFDPKARADLESVRKQVESTGTGVFFIEEIKFDVSGRVQYGEFHCGDGQRYIFDPGYTLPADIPNERWHTKVDSDWYYVLESWN
ncbi:hypothetical protein N9Y81_02265 [Akkermansiaceae bacterium]|jgi:hypothetical protein|nr:hypothetical protein [Akkermansiaceae bacterium]